MPAVDFKVVLYRNVRRVLCAGLDVCPHLDPTGRQLLANMAEMTGVELDALAQIIGCIAVLQVPLVDVLHIVVTVLNALKVDGFAAAALLILKNQRRAVPSEHIDQLQPILEAFVRYRLVVFPSVVHQQIERSVGEKELVRGVVDFLAAKIPDVETEDLPCLQLEFVLVYGNTSGRLAFSRQFLPRLIQTPQQTSFTSTTFSHD